MEDIIKFDSFFEGRSTTFLGMMVDSKIACYKTVSNQGATLVETILIPSTFNEAYGTYTKILVDKSDDKITIQEVGTYELKEKTLYTYRQMKK